MNHLLQFCFKFKKKKKKLPNDTLHSKVASLKITWEKIRSDGKETKAERSLLVWERLEHLQNLGEPFSVRRTWTSEFITKNNRGEELLRGTPRAVKTQKSTLNTGVWVWSHLLLKNPRLKKHLFSFLNVALLNIHTEYTFCCPPPPIPLKINFLYAISSIIKSRFKL